MLCRNQCSPMLRMLMLSAVRLDNHVDRATRTELTRRRFCPSQRSLLRFRKERKAFKRLKRRRTNYLIFDQLDCNIKSGVEIVHKEGSGALIIWTLNFIFIFRRSTGHWQPLTIRYDTIEEINVDSKAEYTA